MHPNVLQAFAPFECHNAPSRKRKGGCLAPILPGGQGAPVLHMSRRFTLDRKGLQNKFIMIVSGIKQNYRPISTPKALRHNRAAVALWKTARKYVDAPSGEPGGIIACDINVPIGEKLSVQEG